MTESNKVTVSYTGEISSALKTSQVKITNNKKKNDVIKVTDLQKNDVVKVYNSKGKLLTSKKSNGKNITISIKQLGKNAGNVYVTITKSGMTESKKTAVNFKKEK